MYSPVKNDFTNIMRLGKNKKKHIIKGTRTLKMDKQYNYTMTNQKSHFRSDDL